MQFDGLEPFREGFPTIHVVTPEARFDLHNDADLREITFDFEDEELRVAWTVKEAAWTDPAHPENWQRHSVAGIVLVFSGVRSVAISGKFFERIQADEKTVDFLEYSRLDQGVGRIRIVLENDDEIAIISSRCRLLAVNKS